MRISPFFNPLVNDHHWLLTSQKETPPDSMCLQTGIHDTANEETSVYYLRMFFFTHDFKYYPKVYPYPGISG